MINTYWEITLCKELNTLCASSQINLHNSFMNQAPHLFHSIERESET